MAALHHLPPATQDGGHPLYLASFSTEPGTGSCIGYAAR